MDQRRSLTMEKRIRCLVTGGSGSFGTILTSLLIAKGYLVTVLDLSTPKETILDSIDFVRGSILDPMAIKESLRDVEIVFHCASSLDTSFFVWKDSREKINVKGTELLLRACCEAEVKSFVYTSTHNVCFRGETVLMADESLIIRDEDYMDEYSRTKSKAEKLVLSFNGFKTNETRSMLTCSIRPGVIWGAGDRHFEKFIYVSCFGFTFRPPEEIHWDWISTIDLANAHLMAAERLYSDSIETRSSSIAGKSFFVGEPSRAVDHWNSVLKGLDLDPLMFVLPCWIWIAIGFLSELFAFCFSPIVDLKKRWFYWTLPESYKLVRTHTFSNKRWKEAFPEYKPQPIEKTIREAIEDWRPIAERVRKELCWWSLCVLDPFRRLYRFVTSYGLETQ